LNAEDKYYEGTIFGMFGMKTYYQAPDGNLEYRVRDPRYRKMVNFMNDLYTENLLDREWVVNKKEQWIQKLSSGNVFATFASYWDTDPANASLLATDGDQAQFYSYKIVPDGMDPSETTYNGRSTLGWDAIGITKNCKNPVAAMKMIDFLASEEGQYLMLWGLEGKHWTMVDGKHVPKPEIVEAFHTNFDETSLKTGIRKWIWFIKNGKGSDGTPYDMATKYKLQKTAEFANKCFGKSDSWDTADFTGLEPAESTPDGLKWQKVEDIYNQTFPKMVDAADENKALAVYNEMIKEMDAAGLEDVEKDISASYRQRMKLWGIDN
jgi:putative aldouronate transport system substrate-binding protein